MFDEVRRHKVRQLSCHLRLPVGQNALGVKRRELLLDLVRKLKVDCVLAARGPFPQNRRRLPRIMVAVVEKENDLAADLALKPAGGDDFGVEKAFWKKSARLLPEANDRRA